MSTVATVGQIAIATVFAMSALLKLRDFSSFRNHVMETLPRSAGFAGTVATSVIAAEAVTAVTLLAVDPPWIGFLFSFIVMTAFTVYLSLLLISRPGTPCGCAGESGQPASWVHVVRNLVIIALTILSGISAGDHAEVLVAEYVALAAPSMVLGAFLLYLGEIAGFFRRSERERMINP